MAGRLDAASVASLDNATFDALDVTDEARDPLRRWLGLLAEWNARIDLTAARTEDELVDLMLADAALLARHIAKGAKVVDVGTGAGAPGLALALMRPDLAVTVVEPLTKRASFLRTVVGTVGRTDITILRERGDAVASRMTDGFDVATSRATLPPPEWIPLGLRFAPITWALLARDEPPVVEGAAIDEDHPYTWAKTGAQRRAVRYVRRK